LPRHPHGSSRADAFFLNLTEEHSGGKLDAKPTSVQFTKSTGMACEEELRCQRNGLPVR
jgi:hypothetical protein